MFRMGIRRRSISPIESRRLRLKQVLELFLVIAYFITCFGLGVLVGWWFYFLKPKWPIALLNYSPIIFFSVVVLISLTISFMLMRMLSILISKLDFRPHTIEIIDSLIDSIAQEPDAKILNLPNLYLAEVNSSELGSRFTKLRGASITNVNLAENRLFPMRTGQQLKQIFQGFKDTLVTSIDLSDNSAEYISGDRGLDGPARGRELATAFSGFEGSSVTNIVLCFNFHAYHSPLGVEGLKIAFSGFKNTPINRIDLAFNDFRGMPTDDLITVLGGFRETNIKNLHFDIDAFLYREPEELKSIFEAFLENNLTTIGFDLFPIADRRKGAEIDSRLFDAIRLLKESGISGLDLRENDLGNTPNDNLKRAFSGLEDTRIRKLNLSGNRLSQKSMNDLEEIFSSIPETVTELDLRNNGFVDLQPQDQELLVNMLLKTDKNILIEEPIAKMLKELPRIPLLLKIQGNPNIAHNPILETKALKFIVEYMVGGHPSTPRSSSQQNSIIK